MIVYSASGDKSVSVRKGSHALSVLNADFASSPNSECESIVS